MIELDDLLTQAREADQQTRIALRNPIAAYSELAIDAMADWLGDARLAGFAIRVLERIGQQQALRSTVISTLAGVDVGTFPRIWRGILIGPSASSGTRSRRGAADLARVRMARAAIPESPVSGVEATGSCAQVPGNAPSSGGRPWTVGCAKAGAPTRGKTSR